MEERESCPGCRKCYFLKKHQPPQSRCTYPRGLFKKQLQKVVLLSVSPAKYCTNGNMFSLAVPQPAPEVPCKLPATSLHVQDGESNSQVEQGTLIKRSQQLSQSTKHAAWRENVRGLAWELPAISHQTPQKQELIWNPIHIYLGISPIGLNGTCFWAGMHSWYQPSWYASAQTADLWPACLTNHSRFTPRYFFLLGATVLLLRHPPFLSCFFLSGLFIWMIPLIQESHSEWDAWELSSQSRWL